MTIIGFVGKKQSGKSTAVEAIADACAFANIPVHRHSFAGPIRAFCQIIGLTPSQIYGADKEKPVALLGGKTPRQFMQLFGTEFARNMIHDKFWVAVWMANLPTSIDDVVLVEDVRFQNEADAIRAVGGKIIRITRDTGIEAASDLHASETEQDYITADHHLSNNGDIGNLARKAILQFNHIARRDRWIVAVGRHAV